jgi:hypothetical protein
VIDRWFWGFLGLWGLGGLNREFLGFWGREWVLGIDRSVRFIWWGFGGFLRAWEGRGRGWGRDWGSWWDLWVWKVFLENIWFFRKGWGCLDLGTVLGGEGLG